MTRRGFQIHLSTALVLMLTAGVLLWANMPHGSFIGWPFPYELQRDDVNKAPKWNRDARDAIEQKNAWLDIVDGWRLFLNITITATILGTVGVANEALARRRSDQKSKLENRESA